MSKEKTQKNESPNKTHKNRFLLLFVHKKDKKTKPFRKNKKDEDGLLFHIRTYI
ncbi:MAG TPA: hypothetical protein VJ991_02795 [Balneolales bacterium]|nr:hypothetical protein [Balneolales bacterium]